LLVGTYSRGEVATTDGVASGLATA
jgi:hypothetical protein